jgi:hypothetical protein
MLYPGTIECFLDFLYNKKMMKAWAAKIDLQDARTEKEKVSAVKHQFIKNLRY